MKTVHSSHNENMCDYSVKGMEEMIYSCEEHIDIAIDTVVDEYETFPQLSKVSEGEELSTTCEYCRNQAIYVVANG